MADQEPEQDVVEAEAIRVDGILLTAAAELVGEGAIPLKAFLFCEYLDADGEKHLSWGWSREMRGWDVQGMFAMYRQVQMAEETARLLCSDDEDSDSE